MWGVMRARRAQRVISIVKSHKIHKSFTKNISINIIMHNQSQNVDKKQPPYHTQNKK